MDTIRGGHEEALRIKDQSSQTIMITGEEEEEEAEDILNMEDIKEGISCNLSLVTLI